MNRNAYLLIAVCGLCVALTATATTRYVNLKNPAPAAPYTSWAAAATNIQDAVDAAVAGDEIVVTNGTYATGARAAGTNLLANRVAVDKPLTLRSVNGPDFTVIQGFQVPGSTNGDGAVRCVYLATGAILSGFTLTNGATRTGWDYDHEQSGGGVWSESTDAVIANCIVVGNSAFRQGGGAYGGTLNNCRLSGNSAYWGAGVCSSTLNKCNLTGNSAIGGGGAFGGTLNSCALIANSAVSGGGAFGGTLNNCTLTGNTAYEEGGGASGGAVDWGTWCRLHYCILYFNHAPRGPNYGVDTELNFCCTTPLPPAGTGNISLDPQLASASHLSAASPCRAAGSADYATGTDIDGEPWSISPSIGCDEYQAGSVTGALSVAISASFTNVSVGFPVALTALIDGRTTASVWDFGDRVTATNQPYATRGWATPGDYTVVLRAYNEGQPTGVRATVTVHVVAQPVHYVASGNTSPAAPYISWATAAKNIQDAVEAATVPGALLLVTNGIYANGGRAVYGKMTNRVAVDKPLVLRSVSGPEFTVIQGFQVPVLTNDDGAIRCVHLTERASLSGFTLTNGATTQEDNGGGVWCESETAIVSNCVVVGNSSGGASGGTLNNCTLIANQGGGAFLATLNNCTLRGNLAEGGGGGASRSTLNNCTLLGNSADFGGGADGSTLNNCTLANNSAANLGGGSIYCTLNNCTLIGNAVTGTNYWPQGGGGTFGSTLTNCILYFNTATNGPNYDPSYDTLNYCCTTPQPTNGLGNITNPPLFVDLLGGNLRLQLNSPCINAGNNIYVIGATDLDDNPRIAGGTVDIGAYEFQNPTSLISHAWLQQYGLPTDGSADFMDADGDGLNNWQEWRCGTDPTNALSALRLLSASATAANVTLTWQSVAGVTYLLERATNLAGPSPFTPLTNGIPGLTGTTTYMDATAGGAGPYFYRVGVGN